MIRAAGGPPDPNAAVDSFNGRTGVVVPASGDYTAAQVTNAFDKSATQTLSNKVTMAAELDVFNGGFIAMRAAAGFLWGMSFVSGDPNNRWQQTIAGLASWGDGTNAPDASFGRQAAGVIGSTDSVIQQKGIKTTAITSGALPTVSPSSGTAFQCSTTRDVFLVVSVTYTLIAGTCLVELSPDNVTFSTLITVAPASAGAVDAVSLQVPAGWRVRLTTTNAVLGTGTYY